MSGAKKHVTNALEIYYLRTPYASLRVLRGPYASYAALTHPYATRAFALRGSYAYATLARPYAILTHPYATLVSVSFCETALCCTKAAQWAIGQDWRAPPKLPLRGPYALLTRENGKCLKKKCASTEEWPCRETLRLSLRSACASLRTPAF